jgi:hypothetical protein
VNYTNLRDYPIISIKPYQNNAHTPASAASPYEQSE